MTESQAIERFKEFCRQEFKELTHRLGLKEVVSPTHKFDNPYKIAFKNKAFFIQFESMSHGFRLATTFGKSSRLNSFSVNDALCLLKGRAEAEKYNGTCPSGYHANLKRDLKVINDNLHFFTQFDDKEKIVALLNEQKENRGLYRV
jgi:hypothetical protein